MEEKKYSRDTYKWVSQYGQITLIKDLDDTHLLNIIDYLKTSDVHTRNTPVVNLLMEELKIRNLKPNTGQVPHKNPKGELCKWYPEYRMSLNNDKVNNFRLCNVLSKLELIIRDTVDDLIEHEKNEAINLRVKSLSVKRGSTEPNP